MIFVLFLTTKDIPLAASAGLFVWQAVSIAAKTKKKKGTEIKIAEVAHLVYDHYSINQSRATVFPLLGEMLIQRYQN